MVRGGRSDHVAQAMKKHSNISKKGLRSTGSTGGLSFGRKKKLPENLFIFMKKQPSQDDGKKKRHSCSDLPAEKTGVVDAQRTPDGGTKVERCRRGEGSSGKQEELVGEMRLCSECTRTKVQ